MLFTKKWFLGLLIFVFLLAVFLDQNTVPVPVKLFVGGPLHLHLSIIIAASMVTGSLITVAVYLVVRQVQTKIKKKRMDTEL